MTTRRCRINFLVASVLAGGLIGCDAFEYYGPLPNLHKMLPISASELGTLTSLEIKRQTLSTVASREVRLVNLVQQLAIEDCQVQDGRALLESVAQLGHLRELTLRRCNLNDDDLAGLSDANQLTSLEIISTDVHGEGLAALAKLPLRSLTFHSRYATPESLKCIAEFSNLEELYLNIPNMSLDSLPSLAKLANLKSISIKGNLDAEGHVSRLDFLNGLYSLTSVYLSADSVADLSMVAIGKLHSLERLELSRNLVTDLGIAELDSLKRLKSIRIWAGEMLTSASIPSIMKHIELEEISLSGAPILHSDAALLNQLPKMTDMDVGMSQPEIAKLCGDSRDICDASVDEPFEAYQAEIDSETKGEIVPAAQKFAAQRLGH